MRRDVQRLDNETFDLCILGGGVNGLATAFDASLRGLRVALIEAGDFGGETSAGSLKILHGGLRYLQHLDFSRMVESIRERNALMRMAPHLARPLGFLVPTTPGLMTGKTAMRAALTVNDLVGWRRNFGILDQGLQLPGGWVTSKREAAALAPNLPMDRVNGGAIFYDAQMTNSDRFTLAFALGADRNGAALANRVRGVEFETGKGRVEALRAVDVETGAEVRIRARQYAAMTGPWRDLLPGLVRPESAPEEVVKNAGVQLVTRRGPCEDLGLALPGGEVDPEATLQRGGRHYFSTPWRGHTLWGTLDKEYRGRPGDWRIREEDIREFLAEINQCLPAMRLRREEVTFAFGGLRMTDRAAAGSRGQVSRRYAIHDHKRDLGLDNLMSMDGVKYTACRVMAEKAVNHVADKLNRSAGPCRTAEEALPGGDFETRPILEAEIKVAVGPEWGADTATWLADTYGSDWTALWREGRDRDLLPDGVTPRVAVDHAVREEMALGLDDVVLRRLPLGTLGPPGDAMVDAVAARMAELLGWDGRKTGEEKEFLARMYRYDA